MRGIATALWILMGCLVAGCGAGMRYAALGPKFEPRPPDASRTQVILYSVPDSGPGSFVHPEVFVNGTSVGTLEPCGYLAYETDPGDTTVAVRFADAQKMIETKLTPGQDRYFRFKPTTTAFGTKDCLHLEEVEARAATTELANARLSRPAATTAPAIPVEQPHARVVVIRPWALFGYAVQANVYVDGYLRGAIANKTAIECAVTPGPTTVALRWTGRKRENSLMFEQLDGWAQATLELTAVAGETYFFTAEFDQIGGDPAGPFWHLKRVPNKDGERLLTPMKATASASASASK